MRIAACPSDREAVGYYRLGLPAMTLMDQGENIDFQFLPGLPLNVNRAGQPISVSWDHLQTDILILQRPTQPWQTMAVHNARKNGVSIVVELDDDLRTVDPNSAFGQQLKPEHVRNLNECCEHADLLTVSTQALAAKYAPHGRVVVLPNYVDERWLEIASEQALSDEDATATSRGISRSSVSNSTPAEQRVVGWTGSIGSHRRDLKATQGGIALALQETGARFRCYGKGNTQATSLIKQTVGVTPEVLPWQSRENYPYEIAKLDVGVAPLENTIFNRSKSALKPTEYAAVEVPCVMSPSSEYQRLHDTYGIGTIAHYKWDWKRELVRLLNDEPYRTEKAAHDHQQVRDHLTIQANAWKWAEAWASCLERAAA